MYPLDMPLLNLTPGQKDPIYLGTIYQSLGIFGASGSGKTSGSANTLALSLLQIPGLGMLICTVKPDEAEWFIKAAEKCGRQDDVIVVTKDSADVLNPLEYLLALSEEGEYWNVLEFISQLQSIIHGTSQKGGGENAFWRDSEKLMLEKMIALLIAAGENVSFSNIYRLVTSIPRNAEFLSDAEFRQSCYCLQCLRQVLEREGNSERFLELDNYFLSFLLYLDSRTFSNIQQGVISVLHPLLSPMMKRLFSGKTTISPELIFQGKIVILAIPLNQFFLLGKLAQNVYRFPFQIAVERRSLAQYPNPVILWIDEFQKFYYPFDSQYILTCRSSRVGNVFITQSLPNLHSALGGGEDAVALSNSLLGNLSTLIFHGNFCYATNSFAVDRIGKTKRLLNGWSASVGDQKDNMNSSFQEQVMYQVEPHAFTMLRTGGPTHQYYVEAIVISTGRCWSNGCNYLPVKFKQFKL